MTLAPPRDEVQPRGKAEEDRLFEAGFRWGDKGAHTSRTLMLEEMRLLLARCPRTAQRRDYLQAIREDNCLAKRTAATRRSVGQRLSELYALDPEVPLFRAMRHCWYVDTVGQPLLAVLLAIARDPLLRATAAVIVGMGVGEELARQRMTDAIQAAAGHRFNADTLDKVVRNTAASWTQSGHLKGRGRKIRQAIRPTAAVVALALFLGELTGHYGTALFNSLWTGVLDTTPGELEQMAGDARRLGLLDLRQSGGIREFNFARLLVADERRPTL